MRTFHIGGTASRVSEQSRLDAKSNGSVRFVGLQTVKSKSGDLVVMNRQGSIAIVTRRTASASVMRSCTAPSEGQRRRSGPTRPGTGRVGSLHLRDPHGNRRHRSFKDLQEGITLHEEVDEVTGLSRHVVADSPDEKRQPALVIKGKASKRYLMPSRAHLMVQDGDTVFPGDVLAKIPRETTKTKDITGWSAACGRTVRSPQAARNRCHQRNRWRGSLRRGFEGTAQTLRRGR